MVWLPVMFDIDIDMGIVVIAAIGLAALLGCCYRLGIIG